MSEGCAGQVNCYNESLSEVFAAKEGNISVQTYEELQLHKLFRRCT